MITDYIKRVSTEGDPTLYLSQGKFPVRFDKEEMLDPMDYIPEIADISNRIWQYSAYAGLGVPWHDKVPLIYPPQYKTIRKFLMEMEKIDVDFRAFCALAFPLFYYKNFISVTKLVGSRTGHWKWIRVLRNYVGSKEGVNCVSNFLWKFFGHQINHKGKIEISKNSVVKSNPVDGFKTKHYALYHEIYDRIKNLLHYGIDIDEWLSRKFMNCIEAFPDRTVYLKTIVNHNAFDPDMNKIKKVLNDVWYPIRKMLELSDICEFPDGCIPKGWRPASGDYEDPSKIVRITKEGFYFYADGTQRRGLRHYIKNNYLTILCTPDNFGEFQKNWMDYSYVSKVPTWDEYCKYALYPGFWNEEGETVRGTMSSVKWRKRP